MAKVSNVQQAKMSQGYRKRSDTCSNCMNLRSDIVQRARETWSGRHVVIKEEKNVRCSLGGFAVNKTATCDMHSLKETESKNG